MSTQDILGNKNMDQVIMSNLESYNNRNRN